LKEEVVFTGKVNDVNSWLSKSNLYVHSAFYEPFGLVLLEAMSTGLPVICTDGKGNRDIIRNGYNGYMIEKLDSVLMANKIIDLMNNHKLYYTLSKNAELFSSEYDIKQYVDKLVTIYETKLK
jgi:glycosyltransferase involved in cell wall biosynthesis